MNNLKKYDFMIHIIEYAIVIVVGFILNVCLYSLIKIIFDLSNSDIIKNRIHDKSYQSYCLCNFFINNKKVYI